MLDVTIENAFLVKTYDVRLLEFSSAVVGIEARSSAVSVQILQVSKKYLLLTLVT